MYQEGARLSLQNSAAADWIESMTFGFDSARRVLSAYGTRLCGITGLRLKGDSMLCKAGRVVLLLSSVLVLSTVAAKAQTESILDKIKRTGVFTAGVRADFPPIGSVDDKGEPIGFGPE